MYCVFNTSSHEFHAVFDMCIVSVDSGNITLQDQSVENAGVAFVKRAEERNKLFEKVNNQLCMTNKCGRTRQRTNNLRGRTDLGMNSASEMATVYYYTRRSIKGGS